MRFPEIEIESKNIPKSFDGFRIAVISDLHYGFLNPEIWIQYLIHKTNNKNPDVILGVGDYVKKRNLNSELKIVWSMLKNLKAKEKVFFVNGNHDHWANHELALELLEKSGFSIRKKMEVIKKGSEEIAFIGLGDFWEDHFPIDELKLTNKEIFTIALAHNPDTVNTFHTTKIDLFITGHTHGGQVRIPFLDYSPVLPVKNKEFDKGLKVSNLGEMVFISTGIGWSILPVRFNCPAEIPILVLKYKK